MPAGVLYFGHGIKPIVLDLRTDGISSARSNYGFLDVFPSCVCFFQRNQKVGNALSFINSRMSGVNPPNIRVFLFPVCLLYFFWIFNCRNENNPRNSTFRHEIARDWVIVREI